MGRMGCCEKVVLKKGPWTPEEDKKLLAYIGKYGQGNWRLVPAKAGLQRCGKSCRLRWINYLKPDIKRGNFSMEEDHTIIQLHALHGNKWSIIAAHLPRRTDNEIKNYWNTNLKKRLIRAGIDPITHKAINSNNFQAYGGDHDHSQVTINNGHVTQLESAQLEAEATGSMMQVGSSSSHIPRLFLSKIPTQPCPSLDLSSSNHKTAYNMYALVLATNHDLHSPVSTLSIPKLPRVTTNIRQFITNKESIILCKGNDNVETGSQIENEVGDYYVSTLQDDDITVAVEAFRKTRSQSIQELFNESSQSIA